MCEDCPIYEGYPVSVLGWDDDEEENWKDDYDESEHDEWECRQCHGSGEVEMDGGFVTLRCGCECHKLGKQTESEEGTEG